MTKNLIFFNTLSNKKEKFFPIKNNKVGMYVCGPTVYDFPHVGNARPLVVFDVLFRLLQKFYGKREVTYVRNITDIDDKIIDSSKQKKKSIKELTEEVSKNFHEDCKYLNCLNPTFEPKATEHIKEMINMISNLLKNNHAYENKKHVYFSVSSFKKYGSLSNKNSEQLISGSRIEVSAYKKDPLDFVLWKPSIEQDPGWDSPWGRGRPGWHLECSVMGEKYLGKHFDIHGGGLDLVFPHHENEIAQSCCANKSEHFANYWLHNGFVTFNKEKMSKSTGTIVTINKLRKNVNGQVIRLALLSSHYKQPLDWNEKLINESQNTLDKWYGQYEKIKPEELSEDVLKPLKDDLNTPEYITKLHSLFEASSKGNKLSKIKFLSACQQIGLLEEDKESWENFKKSMVKIDVNFINQKIEDRNEARKNGNYKMADILRKELEDNGVVIEDKQKQTTWKYK
ncbi:MAG: cysteinyl-tRNA synthetase [Pelagibacterales bacterium]|nr:cysteinyl-tRNA synthetase [Pelagibacterales bacterium]